MASAVPMRLSGGISAAAAAAACAMVVCLLYVALIFVSVFMWTLAVFVY